MASGACLKGASWLVAHLNIHPLLPSIHVSRMRDRDVGADQPTDLELIERWKRGDSRAATLIVERHADALARYASSQGERDELDELVQDTFVRAFGSLENFRGESALRTWLFTIARRLILDRRRAARRARVTVPADEGSAVTEVTPLDVMLADEAEERVRLAIERLTPMQREVFTLRVSEGMSYADIARLVGSTDGAARVHYHHAMRAVKEFLEDA
jgi:RNA polymerase sigma-70 factor (ECF subfamily)